MQLSSFTGGRTTTGVCGFGFGFGIGFDFGLDFGFGFGFDFDFGCLVGGFTTGGWGTTGG